MWNELDMFKRAELIRKGMKAGYTPSEIRSRFNMLAKGGELNQGGESSIDPMYPYKVGGGEYYQKPAFGQEETESPKSVAMKNQSTMHRYVKSGIDNTKAYMSSEDYLKGFAEKINAQTNLAERVAKTRIYDTNYSPDFNEYQLFTGSKFPNKSGVNGFGNDMIGFVVPANSIMSTDKLAYVAGEEFAHAAGRNAENILDQYLKLKLPLDSSNMKKAYGKDTNLLREETRAKMTSFKANNGLKPFMSEKEATNWYNWYRQNAKDPDGLLNDFSKDDFINNLQFTSVDKTQGSSINLGNGYSMSESLA